MKITSKIIVCTGVLLAYLPGVALAQMPNLTLPSKSDKRQLSPEERAREQAVDEAYSRTMRDIPNQQKTADPWGSVRSQPSSTTTTTKKK